MSEVQSPPADDTGIEQTTCPTCYEPFDTEKAKKVHHVRVHGERLRETAVCDYALCNEEFEIPSGEDKRFCSGECYNAHRRDSGRVTLECEVCNDEFEVIRSDADSRRCCSWECRKQNKLVSIECRGCEEEFQVYRSERDRHQFCTWDCYVAFQRDRDLTERVTLECEVCGDEFGVKPSAVDRRSTCSRDCKRIALMESDDSPIRPVARYDKECPVCYATFETIPSQDQTCCSKRCAEIDRQRGEQYFPNGDDPETRYRRLVNHCYIKEGHDIDATTRIVHRRLPQGERWTRDDVEELTGEMLTQGRKFDSRLRALRPEDLGLTPLGGKR